MTVASTLLAELISYNSASSFTARPSLVRGTMWSVMTCLARLWSVHKGREMLAWSYWTRHVRLWEAATAASPLRDVLRVLLRWRRGAVLPLVE